MSINTNRYIMWIAVRNLRHNAGAGFGLSIMTWVSVGGVATGVMSLIIVLSVMGGFAENLQSKMLKGEPHIELFSQDARTGFSLNTLSLQAVRDLVPEAKSVQAFTKADIVLKHRKNLQAGELIGVDPQSDLSLWAFSDTMVEGDIKSLATLHEPVMTEARVDGKFPGIVLGEGLVNNLGVSLGDEVLLINPLAATDSSVAMSAETTMRRYVLTGIFRSADIKYDNKWAIVSLSEGRKFMADYDPSLDDEKFVSAIAFNVKDAFAVQEIKARFKATPWLNPVTWQESNKSLLFALKLEKYAMGCILMLIVLVAAFSISATMMMTVFHRRTQIALLRAIGFTRVSVAKLYIAHGCAIGISGIIAGLGLGLGVCYLINKLQFIDLPRGVYYLTKLPVKFIPETYGVICLAALAFSLIASTFPALTAAMQSPSTGLRYE